MFGLARSYRVPLLAHNVQQTSIRLCEIGRASLQVLLHLFQSWVDAFLVYSGRAGQADSADNVVAHFDRHTAIDGNDTGQIGLLSSKWFCLHLLDKSLRGDLERKGGIGLAPRIFDRVQARIVAPE